MIQAYSSKDVVVESKPTKLASCEEVGDLDGSAVEGSSVVVDERVLVDVAGVDLYYLGEVGGGECRFRLPSAGSPCWLVYRNGHRRIDVDNRLRWNHAPDRGENVAFEALKVAVSVECA